MKIKYLYLEKNFLVESTRKACQSINNVGGLYYSLFRINYSTGHLVCDIIFYVKLNLNSILKKVLCKNTGCVYIRINIRYGKVLKYIENLID